MLIVPGKFCARRSVQNGTLIKDDGLHGVTHLINVCNTEHAGWYTCKIQARSARWRAPELVVHPDKSLDWVPQTLCNCTRKLKVCLAPEGQTFGRRAQGRVRKGTVRVERVAHVVKVQLPPQALPTQPKG